MQRWLSFLIFFASLWFNTCAEASFPKHTAVTNEAGTYWVYQYDSLGHVKSGRRHWADGTPVAGQQYEFAYDNIGNVLAAGTGGDQSGLNLRWASNTFNTVNQLTSRTTPGYVESFGTAHSNATVTVNLQPTQRHGEYYRAELAVNNSTARLNSTRQP